MLYNMLNSLLVYNTLNRLLMAAIIEEGDGQMGNET